MLFYASHLLLFFGRDREFFVVDAGMIRIVRDVCPTRPSPKHGPYPFTYLWTHTGHNMSRTVKGQR